MDADLARPPLGESGRARVDGDAYPTPELNSAALAIGLEKMGLKLPTIALDPCGGVGQLARVLTSLMPGVAIRLSDLTPKRQAADLYATLAPADATIPADLELMLRIAGARAIVSNFPFKRQVYARIFTNCLELLTRGEIELLAVMQRAQRAVDCEAGARETAFEPRFFGIVACPWRAWLWPKQPGEASPKGAYAWQIYRSAPRGGVNYGVYTVTRNEAEAALGAADVKGRRCA
jgi:hypothetical protein